METSEKTLDLSVEAQLMYLRDEVARLSMKNGELLQKLRVAKIESYRGKIGHEAFVEQGSDARSYIEGESVPVLIPAPSMALNTECAERGHILIQGDNLPAAVALAPSMRGSFDLIVIDPDRGSDGGCYTKEEYAALQARIAAVLPLLSPQGKVIVTTTPKTRRDTENICAMALEGIPLITETHWTNLGSGQNTKGLQGQIQSTLTTFLIYGRDKRVPIFREPSKKVKVFKDERGLYKERAVAIESLIGGRAGAGSALEILGEKAPEGMRYVHSKSKVQSMIEDGLIYRRDDGKIMQKEYVVKGEESAIPFENNLNDAIRRLGGSASFKSGKSQLSEQINGATNYKGSFPYSLCHYLLKMFAPADGMVLDLYAGAASVASAAIAMNRDEGTEYRTVSVSGTAPVGFSDDPNASEPDTVSTSAIAHRRLASAVSGTKDGVAFFRLGGTTFAKATRLYEAGDAAKATSIGSSLVSSAVSSYAALAEWSLHTVESTNDYSVMRRADGTTVLAWKNQYDIAFGSESLCAKIEEMMPEVGALIVYAPECDDDEQSEVASLVGSRKVHFVTRQVSEFYLTNRSQMILDGNAITADRLAEIHRDMRFS